MWRGGKRRTAVGLRFHSTKLPNYVTKTMIRVVKELVSGPKRFILTRSACASRDWADRIA